MIVISLTFFAFKERSDSFWTFCSFYNNCRFLKFSQPEKCYNVLYDIGLIILIIITKVCTLGRWWMIHIYAHVEKDTYITVRENNLLKPINNANNRFLT